MRTRLKLKFNDRKALLDLWERELKRGELFIPSNRCLPMQTPVLLVVTVPDAPAPMELPGQVRLAREPQHCAANQRPGMGIELSLQRRERKAVEAYIQGDWAQAALVLGDGEDGSTGSARTSATGLTAAPRAPSGTSAASGLRAVPASGVRPSVVAGGTAATGRTDGAVVAARRAMSAPSAAPMASSAGPVAFAESVIARRGRRPHEVLGLSMGASTGEIRRSYLQLVKQLHPDRYFNRLEASQIAILEEAYQAVNDAYEALQGGGG